MHFTAHAKMKNTNIGKEQAEQARRHQALQMPHTSANTSDINPFRLPHACEALHDTDRYIQHCRQRTVECCLCRHINGAKEDIFVRNPVRYPPTRLASIPQSTNMMLDVIQRLLQLC